MGQSLKIQFSSDFDRTFRGVITKEEATDAIGLFFRGNDVSFHISTDIDKRRRGNHTYNSILRRHSIILSRVSIQDGFEKKERMGGNTAAPTLKMAALMVIAHETQHANQTLSHSYAEEFYTTSKYERRPCERDARKFVDSNMDVLADLAGVSLVKVRAPKGQDHGSPSDMIQSVADDLSEIGEVTLEDIQESLKAANACNSKNVCRVAEILERKGMLV